MVTGVSPETTGWVGWDCPGIVEKGVVDVAGAVDGVVVTGIGVVFVGWPYPAVT
ncbi:MAG: hypothetical protein HGA68_01885, partial [Methanothrix sp.]|nr:hypothetical protein [Methanothrix sp.]